MRVEIINTGSELLLGRLLNSHQQWLCRRLADHGYPVDCQIAVPDTGTAIRDAVREVMERADLIIVTGGLGPTSDDLTRDYIAGLLGKKLVKDSAIVERIRGFFTARRRTMPVNAHVQALVPEGGIVLHNAHGTAPGLALETPRGGLLILLPGPPRELHPMFDEQAMPLIKQRFPHDSPFVCRTVRTSGLGESFVEERISGLLKPFVESGMDLGYCAQIGRAHV